MKKYFKTVIVTSALLLCGCLALLASQFQAHALTPTPVTQSTATQTSVASDPITVGTLPIIGTTPTPTATPTPRPKPTPTVPPAQKPTPQPQPTPTPILSPTQGAGSTFFPTTGSTPTPQATPRTTPTPTPSPTPTTVVATATAVSNGAATASNNQPGANSSTTSSSLLLPIGVSAGVLLLLALVVGLVLLKRSNAQPRRTITPRVPLTPTAPATPLPWAFQQQNADMGQSLGMSVLPQTPAPLAPPAPLMIAAQTSPALNMMPMSPPPAFFNPDNATIASLTGPLNSFSGKQPAIPAPQGNTQPPAMQPYLGMGPLGETYLPSDLRPITSALPKQPSQQPAGQTQLNPISSDMRPLLPDSFDLTQILGTQDQQANTPAPSRTQPSLPIVPPSIQDDPVLETIMRQAQMGLYAHPVPSDSLNDFQQGNTAKHSNMFLL